MKPRDWAMRYQMFLMMSGDAVERRIGVIEFVVSTIATDDTVSAVRAALAPEA